jgi:uncharacterized membrane protein (DUF373 family)
MSIESNSDPKSLWSSRGLGQRLVRACEVAVVSAAAILVIISVMVGSVILYVLFVDGIKAGSLTTIESTAQLQELVEDVFAGILLLLLGLELLQSLTSFFLGHHLRLEIIVVVAMIAVSRHVMLMNFEHVSAANLLGTAALILALATSFALVRQRRSDSAEAPEP